MQAKALFEILMRENADMLLAFLRATVRDTHAVEDLFQETMIVGWRRLDDFDQQRSFGKWLRGIAGKLVLAHYRKSNNQELSFEPATLDWMEAKFAGLQKCHGDTFAEKLQLLNECVQALSEEYRVTIEAKFQDDKSLDEMVSALGIAAETIKKRLYRAKLQLSQCVESKLLSFEGLA